MPPPTPPEAIWPMIEPISRPPAPARSDPVPPPTGAPMIWAPTPPPIKPAIELPIVPRLYCFIAAPAMLPPTATGDQLNDQTDNSVPHFGLPPLVRLLR